MNNNQNTTSKSEDIITTNKKMVNLQTYGWIITLGGLLFGIDTGATNGSLTFMSKPSQLNLNASDEGLVTSGITLGAAFGAIIGGKLSDHFGRKRILMYSAWIFILGTLGCTFAPNAYVMILCRFVLGLAVGAESVISPVFLAELSTPQIRGKFVNHHELMIVVGQLLSYIINALFGVLLGSYSGIWRYMLAVGLIPEILLLIGINRVPESPRWLVTKHNDQQALHNLEKIRDSKKTAVAEIAQIKVSLTANSKQKKVTFKDLKTPWIRRLILIGIGLGIMQQAIGINIIMFYGTTVLSDAGFSHSAALIANISNGIISTLATIASIRIMGVVNRRKMVITAICGTTITMLTISVLSFFLKGSFIFPFVMLLLMAIFLIFFQGGVSPIVWVLLSEIFPQAIRGMAMGIATFFLWLSNFLVGYLFPILLEHLGLGKTFVVFTILNVVSLLYAIKFIPETQGKSLEELQSGFQDGYEPQKHHQLDDGEGIK
ncbi:sugar porter family MFS transporter [Lactobacillus xylocopicola]|uniref:MFS transporter n=1 Tax=Lactobacillus xylocopicola TaxID=2976676 RepID=A0ABM8BFC9_9LACO|nr:sugar porter family MFS transporter [Lactobacillus xylocopicola]BDR59918.1 MFS transporter [Lactobacillus xylocopicola]